jgi:hypothetical protein
MTPGKAPDDNEVVLRRQVCPVQVVSGDVTVLEHRLAEVRGECPRVHRRLIASRVDHQSAERTPEGAADHVAALEDESGTVLREGALFQHAAEEVLFLETGTVEGHAAPDVPEPGPLASAEATGH